MPWILLSPSFSRQTKVTLPTATALGDSLPGSAPCTFVLSEQLGGKGNLILCLMKILLPTLHSPEAAGSRKTCSSYLA